MPEESKLIDGRPQLTKQQAWCVNAIDLSFALGMLGLVRGIFYVMAGDPRYTDYCLFRSFIPFAVCVGGALLYLGAIKHRKCD